MINAAYVVAIALALAAVVALAVLAARWWLDRREDWDPWQDTATFPAVPGRHRMELLTEPFRLPGWD